VVNGVVVALAKVQAVSRPVSVRTSRAVTPARFLARFKELSE
jgi:hypothetical protein